MTDPFEELIVGRAFEAPRDYAGTLAADDEGSLPQGRTVASFTLPGKWLDASRRLMDTPPSKWLNASRRLMDTPPSKWLNASGSLSKRLSDFVPNGWMGAGATAKGSFLYRGRGSYGFRVEPAFLNRLTKFVHINSVALSYLHGVEDVGIDVTVGSEADLQVRGVFKMDKTSPLFLKKGERAQERHLRGLDGSVSLRLGSFFFNLGLNGAGRLSYVTGREQLIKFGISSDFTFPDIIQKSSVLLREYRPEAPQIVRFADYYFDSVRIGASASALGASIGITTPVTEMKPEVTGSLALPGGVVAGFTSSREDGSSLYLNWKAGPFNFRNQGVLDRGRRDLESIVFDYSVRLLGVEVGVGGRIGLNKSQEGSKSIAFMVSF